MRKLTYSLSTFFLLLASSVQAQGDNPDFFRSIGKIYVVVAVVVTIFIGIVLFLIYLERKLSNLEHQIKDNE